MIAMVAGRSHPATVQALAAGMLLVAFEGEVAVKRWQDFKLRWHEERSTWAWVYARDVVEVDDEEVA